MSSSATRVNGWRAGAIYRVRMHDFLTYRDAELYPGPRLNVIVGNRCSLSQTPHHQKVFCPPFFPPFLPLTPLSLPCHQRSQWKWKVIHCMCHCLGFGRETSGSQGGWIHEGGFNCNSSPFFVTQWALDRSWRWAIRYLHSFGRGCNRYGAKASCIFFLPPSLLILQQGMG